MPKLKKVLLCQPDNFSVDYIINTLMQPHSVDKKKAMEQWQNMAEVYRSIGIEVEVIRQPEGVPDMVFAVDHGIVKGNSVLLANMRYDQRKKESQYYRKWFIDHGYELNELSNVNYFEGGDARYFNEEIFLGTGYRANKESAHEMSQHLDTEVIPIEIIDPDYYHIDTSFLPINSQTAFYYPPSYSEESNKVFESKIPNLIALNKTAAEDFAANSQISGKDIVTQSEEPEFTAALKELGMNIHVVDVSEFNKAGGGIRCMTLPLELEE